MGGLYGFARDPDGVVKIGYCGTKFANLGGHVVDRIEGKTNGYLEDWKWRARDAGVKPYKA
ncbi:hypothetical protein MY3957_003683 [Beauveria namnaoensis]